MIQSGMKDHSMNPKAQQGLDLCPNRKLRPCDENLDVNYYLL